MSLGLCVALLAALADAPVTVPCVASRLVRVGEGCIELPCEYASGSQSWATDIGGGDFAAASDPCRITWTAGSICCPLDLAADEKLVWRWPAFHGWRFWWHALTEIQGKQTYRVANGRLILQAPAEMPNALSRLESLAASYTTRASPSACEQPILVQPRRRQP